MSEAHYLNNLYPMQDKVFQIFSEAEVRHYLTGGTALSRVFLSHRYSDDLDFFLNNDPDFENESERAITLLHQHFENVTVDNRQLDFRRLFITQDEVTLKIDFINDVAYHLNGFEKTNIYYKTDNPLNILSNKIAALNRQAAKDIADITGLCRKYAFTWPEIIEQASKKDNWVNEIDVLTAIKTFDQKKLFTDVIWIQAQDPAAISSDIKKICFDIASAASNSLFSSPL
jgi:predicted nucleotidyltransferase component of viral defense system